MEEYQNAATRSMHKNLARNESALKIDLTFEFENLDFLE